MTLTKKESVKIYSNMIKQHGIEEMAEYIYYLQRAVDSVMKDNADLKKLLLKLRNKK